MSEHSSDQDDSDNQNDEIHNQRSKFLTRQVVALDDNWTMKNSRTGNKFSRSSNQGEATLLEIEPDEASFIKQTVSHKKVNLISNGFFYIVFS